MGLLRSLEPLLSRQLLELARFFLSDETCARRHPLAVRLMTYNVHGCVGADGRLSTARIARAIEKQRVDVAALQEVDVGRVRSGGVDQARELGGKLRMHHAFCASRREGGGQYGNAVLSRFPLRVVRHGPLPGDPSQPAQEPRSAMWVSVDHPAGEVLLLNTHLGLDPGERALQARAIVRDWLGDRERCVVCGDFNARPDSPAHSVLASALRDARQTVAPSPRRATWPAPWPVLRLDHVFVGTRLRVESVEVPFNRLTRIASDHLPVIATV